MSRRSLQAMPNGRVLFPGRRTGNAIAVKASVPAVSHLDRLFRGETWDGKTVAYQQTAGGHFVSSLVPERLHRLGRQKRVDDLITIQGDLPKILSCDGGIGELSDSPS